MADIAGTWPATAGEDSELLTGLRSGSQAAFDWLLARYQVPVYNLVYRMLRDPNDAPDTVQEIFLKVFRGLSGFKGDCSLKTWIYRIAVHEASNQRRWWFRHRRRELSLEAPLGAAGEEGRDTTLADSLMDESRSPFEQAAGGELQAVVLAALAELPSSFRAVLLLRDVEDLSYEEIAEVLGVRVGTVKSRLARAREALRPRLARRLAVAETERPEGAGGAAVGEFALARNRVCL